MDLEGIRNIDRDRCPGARLDGGRMTGIQALQALLDGKKLTIPDIRKMNTDSEEEFYVQVCEFVRFVPEMVWLSTTGERVITNPSTYEYGNFVDASLFLRDDWEVFE